MIAKIIVAVAMLILIITVMLFIQSKLRGELEDDDHTFEILGQTRGVKDKWL